MRKYIGLTKPINVIAEACANVDAKYGPYDSIDKAIKEIPETLREIGMTVGIITDNGIKEFWWKKDIKNTSLELKLDLAAYTKTSELTNDADFINTEEGTALVNVEKERAMKVEKDLALTKADISYVDSKTTKFKGYHQSIDKLNIAHPKEKNEIDFYAFVGSEYPGTVHKVFETKGDWVDTKAVPDMDGFIIDFREYAKIINDNGDKVVYAPEGIVDITHKTNKSTIINVSQENNDTIYENRTTARNGVKASLRGKGQIIVYKLKSSPTPITEIYIGDVVDNWDKEELWMEIPYIKDIEVIDDDDSDFIIPYVDRGGGMPSKTSVYYEYQDMIRGKAIDKIKLSGNKGTLTIRISTITTDPMTETILRSYKIPIPSYGLQTIKIDEEIIVGEDEFIGFIIEAGDSGGWQYAQANGITGSEPNFVGGGCYSFNHLGHKNYYRHHNVNIAIAVKSTNTNPTNVDYSKIPKLDQLSDIAFKKNVRSTNIPFSISDEAGNDVMRIGLSGEAVFGKLSLPENITESIKQTIDEILGNVTIGGAGGTYNDRDAKLWGIGGNKLVFIHLSDTHSYMPAFEKIIEVQKYYGSLIRAYIHSGDIVESGQGVEKLLERLAKKNFNVPLLWCMGNHDGESDSTPINTKAQQYERLIAPFKDRWNAVTEENKCYYYKDLGYNVRLIALDLFDSTDKPNNQSLSGWAMSNEQVQWFIKTLQDANTKGLHIIINSHTVPGGTGSQKGNLITDVLLAFKNGTAVNNTYEGQGTYPAITVDAAFSKKGNFITFLAGHDHRESTGMNSVGRFKIASFAGNRHNQDGFLRIIGTPTEHNFDIVIVDTTAKLLRTFRIGAAYTPDGKRNSSELELEY